MSEGSDPPQLRTDGFDYELPEALVASRPLERRDGARMMLVEREAGRVSHHRFADFEGLIGAGDLCVFNDTRVVRSRFFSDDGRVELVRTAAVGERCWKAMVRPGKRMKPGREVVVGGVVGTVVEVCDDGERLIEWAGEVSDAHGELALPHYLGREAEPGDEARYQTVYAREPGAIAAPTAGLHFTPELVARLRHVFVTLHVGVGTFRPVSAERVVDHVMHRERYSVGADAARAISGAGRVVAVGTTVCRVLEHLGREAGGRVEAGDGETSIFIYPGFEFRVVGGLLTNFHLPRSTLLMLVSAFAGRELVLEAYAKAVEARYRFYSYGDCMLIV